MKEQVIPLVGSPVHRPYDAAFEAKDQRFENCYPILSKNPITGQGSIGLAKRNGSAPSVGPGTGYAGRNGACLWTGYTSSSASRPIAVFPFISSSTTVSVYDTAGQLVGAAISNAHVGGTPICISETLVTNGGTALTSYLTLTSTKSTDYLQHAWYLKQGDSSWTEITDVDFPPNQNGTATGEISGTTLTTSASSTGVNFPVGTIISGAGVSFDTRITAIGTAVAGVGTYTVSKSQTVSAGTTVAGGVPIVGRMVHMDGFAFVVDYFGNVWNSDVNSLANWTSTNFINSSIYPDNAVGIERSGNYIVVFGTNSIEFFQNTGNAVGSPLTRIPSLSKKIGLSANGYLGARTAISVDGVIYFIGTGGDAKRLAFYKIEGAAITKISNTAIDMELSISSAAFGIAGHFVENGMVHIMLAAYVTSGGSPYYSVVPVYCVDTNYWWYRPLSFSTGLVHAIASDRNGSFLTTVQSASATPGCNGKINGVGGYLETDGANATAAITLKVITMPLDQGTSRKKFYHAAELVCDKQSTSGNISISWSDDDYANFSTARTIDPSSGQRRITRLGSSKRDNNNKRAWKIEETVNRPFRAESLKLWYTEGTS